MENHDYEEWPEEDNMRTSENPSSDENHKTYINTWPGEHYKKTKAKKKYIGRLKPPTATGGEELHSPPVWRVCPDCSGTGSLGPYYECEECGGKGRIPLFYTPEQWKETGGILSDDLPVWVKSDGEWIILAAYGNFKNTQMKIIIATEAGRPPEEGET